MSILEGVKTAPGDDLAWLALADWLEEHGQPGPAELHRLLIPLRQQAAEGRGPLEERLRYLLASGVRPVAPTEEVHLGKGEVLKLALIPPGSFRMGSPEREEGHSPGEGPIHLVRLTRGFFLGIYPVTQAQWQQVMGEHYTRFHGGDRPVVSVSWEQCQEFCGKLTVRTGRRFRLPTEAEWEYACRAGTTTPFHFGATISTRQANYNGCIAYGRGRKGTYRRHTMSVGSFAPNAFGLFDVHGNVEEWCLDAYLERFYRDSPAEDPRCYGSDDSPRVVRGGSWAEEPAGCRSASRSAAGHWGSSMVGCRVVMEGE